MVKKLTNLMDYRDYGRRNTNKILISFIEKFSFENNFLLATLKLLRSIDFDQYNDFESLKTFLESDIFLNYYIKFRSKITKEEFYNITNELFLILFDSEKQKYDYSSNIELSINEEIRNQIKSIKSEIELINILCREKDPIKRDIIIRDEIKYLPLNQRNNSIDKYNLLYKLRISSLKQEEKEELIKLYRNIIEKRNVKQDQLIDLERNFEDYEIVKQNIITEKQASFFDYRQLNIYDSIGLDNSNVEILFDIAKNHYFNDPDRGLKELAKISKDTISYILKSKDNRGILNLLRLKHIDFNDIIKINKSEIDDLSNIKAKYRFKFLDYVIDNKMNNSLAKIISEDRLLSYASNGEIEKLKYHIKSNIEDISPEKLRHVFKILPSKYKKEEEDIINILLSIDVSKALIYGIDNNNIILITNILDREDSKNLSAEALGALLHHVKYSEILGKTQYSYLINKIINLPNIKYISVEDLSYGFVTMNIIGDYKLIRKLFYFENIKDVYIKYDLLNFMIRMNDEEITRSIFLHRNILSDFSISNYMLFYSTALQSDNKIAITEIFRILNDMNLSTNELEKALSYKIKEDLDILSLKKYRKNMVIMILNLDNAKNISLRFLFDLYKTALANEDQDISEKIMKIANMKNINYNILGQNLCNLISEDKNNIEAVKFLLNINNTKKISIYHLRTLYKAAKENSRSNIITDVSSQKSDNYQDIVDRIRDFARTVIIPSSILGDQLIDVVEKNDCDGLELLLSIKNIKDVYIEHIGKAILVSKSKFAGIILDSFEILKDDKRFLSNIKYRADKSNNKDLSKLTENYLLKIEERFNYNQDYQTESYAKRIRLTQKDPQNESHVKRIKLAQNIYLKY